MERIGKELGVDFVISTGDNFYEDGLTGINDTAFEDFFSPRSTRRRPCRLHLIFCLGTYTPEGVSTWVSPGREASHDSVEWNRHSSCEYLNWCNGINQGPRITEAFGAYGNSAQ